MNVTLSQNSYEFAEDATDEEVCVSLVGESERSVTVFLNTSDLTATGNL